MMYNAKLGLQAEYVVCGQMTYFSKIKIVYNKVEELMTVKVQFR